MCKKIELIALFFIIFHTGLIGEELCVKINIKPEFFKIGVWDASLGSIKYVDPRTYHKYKDLFNPKIKIDFEYKKGLFSKKDSNKFKYIEIPKNEHQLLPCIPLVSGFTVKDIKNIRVTISEISAEKGPEYFSPCEPHLIEGPIQNKLKIQLDEKCSVSYYLRD